MQKRLNGADEKLYRVRKSWSDSKTQAGAYKKLENAKKKADEKKSEGYKVFDWDGNCVYEPVAKAKEEAKAEPKEEPKEEAKTEAKEEAKADTKAEETKAEEKKAEEKTEAKTEEKKTEEKKAEKVSKKKQKSILARLKEKYGKGAGR